MAGIVPSSLRPGFAGLPKAMPSKIGYAKSAELYFKHMCATEPILALSWALGLSGLMMPLMLKNSSAKAKVIDGQLMRIQPDQTQTGV